MTPAEQLATQLQVLRAQLALDPATRVLRVEIAATRRALRRLTRAADAQPLPQLLARLAAGEISLADAGDAIRGDAALAAQMVQAVNLAGAQTGDVSIGEVAGGNIYHIHYGARHE